MVPLPVCLSLVLCVSASVLIQIEILGSNAQDWENITLNTTEVDILSTESTHKDRKKIKSTCIWPKIVETCDESLISRDVFVRVSVPSDEELFETSTDEECETCTFDDKFCWKETVDDVIFTVFTEDDFGDLTNGSSRVSIHDLLRSSGQTVKTGERYNLTIPVSNQEYNCEDSLTFELKYYSKSKSKGLSEGDKVFRIILVAIFLPLNILFFIYYSWRMVKSDTSKRQCLYACAALFCL